MRASLVAKGDPTATAHNILGAQSLFRFSLAADALMAVCDVALAIALLVLLRPAGPVLALSATAFRLVQAAILGMNLSNQHAALLWLQAPGVAPDQAAAMAMLALEVHSHGYDLGLVFFGVSCLLVGLLLWRSALFPRALGVLIAASGCVYLIGSALRFLSPAAAPAFEPFYLVPLIGESAFCLWLLFKGAAPR